MREQPGISEEHLQTCLQDYYTFSPITLEFLPRGRDYRAGVYRVVDEQGTVCLLKVTSRSLDEASCLVPRHLNDQGIPSVVAPMPTRSGALWTKADNWTVIVYPFIDGDTSLAGMTNEQWKEVGTIFKRIHQVILPSPGIESLRKETFDPTEYVRWIRSFETQHLHAQHDGDEPSRALRASWMTQQSMIHAGVTRLQKLAAVLRRRTFSSVICHADLHPANLIRDRHGRVFVIDWDEVMLAPKERDFIFLREPQTDAFWEGYGQREIDWVALAYYLWERVIQDVIANAQDVCLRNDLGEETRAEIAYGFHEYLTEGECLAAASQASVHLTI